MDDLRALFVPRAGLTMFRLNFRGFHHLSGRGSEGLHLVSVEDPSTDERPEGTDPPDAAPVSAENENDAVSPRQKRKMKDALDDFLESS